MEGVYRIIKVRVQKHSSDNSLQKIMNPENPFPLRNQESSVCSANLDKAAIRPDKAS